LRDIEESLDAVRAAFDAEYSEILSRIEEANESLESEAQLQGEFNTRKKVLEPSTADLQRLAKKLQQVTTLPRADEKLPSMSRVHRLRSLVQNFRPRTPLLDLIDEDAPSTSTKTGKPSLEELLFEPAPAQLFDPAPRTTPRTTPRAG
jgi:DNA repair ATPase RecN